MATLDEIITATIQSHLAQAQWNQRAAARTLGISRWKLGRLMRKHGVVTPTQAREWERRCRKSS